MRRVATLLFVLAALAAAQNYTINTVAGGGVGDGTLATGVSLNPHGLTIDAAGNIYVADVGLVRKIAAATSIITTVAGNGTFASTGDGGPASGASVEATAVALDSAGNLYIAGPTSIRKITGATGVITTIAGNGTAGYGGDGGPATSASINFAQALAVDFSGNVYIADQGNNRVRLVTAATGIITTIAGTGVASYSGDGGPSTGATLNRPTGVALDSAGNLFISDEFNFRIRKVVLATGIITTAAGNGATNTSYPTQPWGTYSGDGGPATSAGLNTPSGIATDSSRNLYIADYENSRIRKVAVATGIITTVAGNGSESAAGDGGPATGAGLPFPSYVAADSAGNLFIATLGVIRKVTAATGIITTVGGNGTTAPPAYSGDGGPATSATFFGPQAVALDSSGNLYIADSGNNRIRKVMAATGIITTVAGNGTSGFSGDGGLATSAQFTSPSGIALDSAGNIYIADVFNQRIRKVTAATGIITTIAGNGISSYNQFTGVIGTYSGDGGPATSAGLSDPSGVAVDFSGNVYIADDGNSRIREVAAATGIITTVAGGGASLPNGVSASSAALSRTSSVALDSAGNLYLVDTLSSNSSPRISKVTAATGIITPVAGNGTSGFSGDGGPATSAGLNGTGGIAFDAAGNLYIADSFNFRVRQVAAPTGTITTIAGNGNPGYSGDGGPATNAALGAAGLAVDSSGNVYVADNTTTCNCIRQLTPQNPLLAITLATSPAGLNLTIDGAVTTTPLTFSWISGSTHTLFAPDQTAGSGLVYAFTSWSQGGPEFQSVTASAAATYTANFQLLPPVISCPLSAVAAQTGVSYTINCTATGGVAPFTWSIAAGALPGGLTLNPSTGVITGMPSAAGSYSFTVQAVDSNSPAQTATLTVGFSVTSPLCAVTLSSGSVTITGNTVNLSDAPTNFLVNVTADPSCTWTANSNNVQINILVPATDVSGNPEPATVPSVSTNGFGILNLQLRRNTSSQPQTGTFTVNGATLTVIQAGSTFDANTRFIYAMYDNVLAREPDAGGLAAYQAGLANGTYTRDLIGADMFGAPEFNLVERFTVGLYFGILGRDPEYFGWDFQRRYLQLNITQQGTETAAFLNSTEYGQKYGTPDVPTFVTEMYQNAFSRTPAPSEITAWENQLAQPGNTRATAAQTILSSPEFAAGKAVRQTVFLIHAALLGRVPTAAEYTEYINSLNGGLTTQEAIAQIITGAEFLGKIGP